MQMHLQHSVNGRRRHIDYTAPKVPRMVVVQHAQQDDPADYTDDKHGRNEWTPQTRAVRCLKMARSSEMLFGLLCTTYRGQQVHGD
jgi:hypothetical protein